MGLNNNSLKPNTPYQILLLDYPHCSDLDALNRYPRPQIELRPNKRLKKKANNLSVDILRTPLSKRKLKS